MNPAPFFIGIDPGLSGAVGALDPTGAFYDVRDLATTPLPGGGTITRRLDGAELVRLFSTIVPDDVRAIVCVENVQTWGTSPKAKRGAAGTEEPAERGMGVSQMAAMVGTKLVILAALDLYRSRFDVRLVAPQTWKRGFGLMRPKDPTKSATQIRTLTKAMARARAREEFPGAELHLSEHDNRAEALLIARYIRDVWRAEGSVFDAPVAPAQRRMSVREQWAQRIDESIPFGVAR